jgi:hypothetical protein
MRRSVIWLAAAATSCVVIALLVALGEGLHRVTTDEATVAASVAAQDLATVVGSATSPAQIRSALATYEEGVGGVRAQLVRGRGGTVPGPAAAQARQRADTRAVGVARTQGRTAVVDVEDGRELVVPVFRTGGPPDVLQVLITDDRLHQGLARAYVVLALLGAMLVALATLAADRLGRYFVRPVGELAVTARRWPTATWTSACDPAARRRSWPSGLLSTSWPAGSVSCSSGSGSGRATSRTACGLR